MPLWGAQDANTSAPVFAPLQLHVTISAANRNNAYNNVTANAFISQRTDGIIGVDSNEMNASAADNISAEHPTHSGWNLRTVGQGGRAGRVFYETLVATGSMSGISTNTILQQYTVKALTQPVANTQVHNKAATISVVAGSFPAHSIVYKWQQDMGTGVGPWLDVQTNGNTAIYVAGSNANATLQIANNTLANGNTYRVLMNVDAYQAISANAKVLAT